MTRLDVARPRGEKLSLARRRLLFALPLPLLRLSPVPALLSLFSLAACGQAPRQVPAQGGGGPSDSGPSASLVGFEQEPRLAERILLDKRIDVASPLETAPLADVPPRLAAKSRLALPQVTWILCRGQPEEQTLVKSALGSGGGVILLLTAATRPETLALVGLRVERSEAAAIALRPGAAISPVGDGIRWGSAPALRRRTGLAVAAGAGGAGGAGGMALANVVASEDGRPVLLAGSVVAEGAGLPAPGSAPRLLLVAAHLADPSNAPLWRWPYFNYWLYRMTALAAARSPESFADWPWSPLPQRRTRIALGAMLLLLWPATVLLFLRMRRRSRSNQPIERFFAAASAATRLARGADAGWSRVGFARPLSGFLFFISATLVLLGPYFYVNNVVIPNHVQPFPEADGTWFPLVDFFVLVWTVFDLGTTVAFIKYFAEYKHSDPKEAMASVQFFNWWQILSGLVQVTLMGLLGANAVPRSSYAFYSQFVILHSLVQFPGIFASFTLFLQAYQRFDYQLALDLLEKRFLIILVPIPFVLLGRAWGGANPIYGEAFGAVLGLGAGQYVTLLIVWGLGYLLYRRVGLPAAPLFYAHFSRRTVTRQLAFGGKLTLGQIPLRLSQSLEFTIITTYLLNFTEWLGIRNLIYNKLIFLYWFAWPFFDSGVAAISEAFAAGKRTLSQYYVVRYFQYGHLFVAMVLSFLAAVGPDFIRGAMDPQWARAADYIVLAACVGVFLPAAWIADTLQKACGRPGLNAWVMILEQVLRLGLLFLLVPRFQFLGLFAALYLTLAIKCTVAWLANQRLVLRLRLFPYAMLVAPALAGAINYCLWRLCAAGISALAAGVSWLPPRPAAIALMVAAGLGSFLLCFFLCGLVGGFDRAALAELAQAADMAWVMRRVARLYHSLASLGSRLSPLEGRFPVRIAAEAAAEAAALEAQAAGGQAPAAAGGTGGAQGGGE